MTPDVQWTAGRSTPLQYSNAARVRDRNGHVWRYAERLDTWEPELTPIAEGWPRSYQRLVEEFGPLTDEQDEHATQVIRDYGNAFWFLTAAQAHLSTALKLGNGHGEIHEAVVAADHALITLRRLESDSGKS